MTDLDTPPDLTALVQRCIAEDVGSGDITAKLIAAEQRSRARILSKEAAVICGLPWADEVFRQLDSNIEIEWLVRDGDSVSENQDLALLYGPSRALLTGERTALNFLQTLSATATLSRKLSRLLAHTSCQVLDTRKTLPGLRTAQKYAVACGGSSNHRIGLFDAFLIKENHIRACGSIGAAVALAREQEPDKTVEVEVETLEQLEEALEAQADVIMLDNFTVPDMRRAVAVTNKRAKLEASGMVDEERLVEIAATGVDFVSCGALSKNCRAIDLSMLFTQ